MPLMMILGGLGSGKTLCLTYLALRNHLKGRKIYANYKLNFPYERVYSVEKISEMHSGFFAGDELWAWLDSQASSSKKNKVITDILTKSRKRGISIAYTLQHKNSIHTRVRSITDYIAKPMMSSTKKFCRLVIYTRDGLFVKSYRFKSGDIFPLYDTEEEVGELEF